MLRRTFFKILFGSVFLPATARTAPPRRTLLLQEAPLAGFQYCVGDRLWSALAGGDSLNLRREPANPYDPRAVAVYRHSHKLGYLPRVENSAAAQFLDRGERLQAGVAQLSNHGAPWQRMRPAVHLAV